VLIVTREALLSAAKLKPVKDLKRSLRVIREAHTAVTSKGAPDHAIRLAAADRILDLVDVRKPRNDGADPSRPVNVNILIGDRGAAAALPARQGYVLQLAPQTTQQTGSSAASTTDDVQQTLDLSQSYGTGGR
jgi:hypothetical protein